MKIYLITTRTYTATDTKEGKIRRGIVKLWLEQYDIYYDQIIYCIDDKVIPCKNNNIDIMIDDLEKTLWIYLV